MDEQELVDKEDIIFESPKAEDVAPEVTEGPQNTLVQPLESEPRSQKTLSSYSYLVLPILAVLSVLGFGLLIFSDGKSTKNVTEAIVSPTPVASVATIVEPTLEPSPSPVVSIKPSPSPKASPSPTVKPSPSPSPTPTVVVDNSFTCGTFSGTTYPALPAIGPTPLYVTLYPSGGTTSGITLVGFEWDFDGDGVWEGGVANGKVGRTYEKSGTFTAKYRSKGSNGAVGPTCTYPYQIVAGGGYAYQNDIIKVDKQSMEVTISKSKNNHTFTGYQSEYNDKPGYIYVPYVNISTKTKANAIVLTAKEGASPEHGTSTGSSYMDPGTLWPTHLWVSKSLATGTYEGEMKIQTTDDSGVTRYDATTVTYKINLVD